MPRTVLDEGLRQLHAQMMQVAQEVEHALLTTLAALQSGEYQTLAPLIVHDLSIDGMCAATEQQALRLLILHQPLAGQDLRSLTAALFIADQLGNIGDAVAQVGQTLLQMAALRRQSLSTEGSAVDQQGYLTEVFILRGLLLLGEEIQALLAATLEALGQRDGGKARTIVNEHVFVERRYAPLCQDIQQMQYHLAGASSQQNDTFVLQWLPALLWIAHKFAEMATSITTICKRVIFIVEG